MVIDPVRDQVLHSLGIVPVVGRKPVVESVCLHDAVHIEMDAKSGRIRHLQLSADDLRRVTKEVLTVLPDPVGIQRSGVSDRRCADLRKCRQRDVKMVIGMNAPGKSPIRR